MDSDGWMEGKERKVHFLFLHPPSSLILANVTKYTGTQHECFLDPYYVRITDDWVTIVFYKRTKKNKRRKKKHNNNPANSVLKQLFLWLVQVFILVVYTSSVHTCGYIYI